MKKFIKSLVPPILIPLCRTIRDMSRSEKAKQRDATVPPAPKIKQDYVKSYGVRFGISSFVETGTFLGDMINAAKKTFSEIYSVELSKELYERATQYYMDDAHIHLIQGDSGRVISELTQKINKPCLFWLDAHYSGGITAQGDVDTPIMAELSSIMQRKYNDVILIDDARCFIGEDQYPTIEYVQEYVGKVRPEYKISVKDDIIFIHP